MKLLLDQGLARSTVPELAKLGHDAVHVSDLGLARATDAGIIDRGRADARVIVTLDADFHTLIALAAAASPSVIRIRDEGLRAPAMAHLIQRVIQAASDALAAGALVSVDAGRVRIRMLPIQAGD